MSLSDEAVQKQLRHMIAFMEQEAIEKSEEIDAKAEEDFNVEKHKIVCSERDRILLVYAKKHKQLEQTKKIERSNVLNKSRIEILKAKDKYVRLLKDEIYQGLQKFANSGSDGYRQLLDGLIRQSLEFLEGEDEIQIRCRQRDVDFVKKIIAAQTKDASSGIQLTVSDDYLSDSSCGGVISQNSDGKIQVFNTLDSRMDIAFEQMFINDSHFNGGVLLFNGERIIIYYKGIKADFQSSNPLLRESLKGKIYLTTHRIILIQDDKPKHTRNLMSYAFPFHCVTSINVEQPIFGANYLDIHIKPMSEGTADDYAVVKIAFNKGGAIEFAKAIRKATQMSENVQNTFTPPDYCNVVNNPQVWTAVSSDDHAMFPNADSWASHKTLRERPEVNEIYVKEDLPPYAGVVHPDDLSRLQFPKTESQTNNAFESQDVGKNYGLPPAYEEITKK